ncbi:MAG: CHASE2 domain-containing protein [Spirochaetes bacterium]|nr:CHASE2 domain-containing protein [Spirochaetota bacterium]
MLKIKIPRLIIIILIGITVFLFNIIILDFFLNRIFQIRLQNNEFNLFELFEKKSLDILLNINEKASKTHFLSSQTSKRITSNKVSKDIMIIGVDEKSLNKIGKWPFRRYYHGLLADYFTKSKYRENLLFFDIFFTDQDFDYPEDDIILTESIKNNDKVILDYFARGENYDLDELATNEKLIAARKRLDIRNKKFGVLKDVSGSVDKALPFNVVSLPLMPYLDTSKQIGLANITEDFDKIVRKYPLVSKFKNIKKLKLSELLPNTYADEVYLTTFTFDLAHNNELKILFRDNILLFNQSAVPLNERKSLTDADLSDFKFKVEQQENNLKLDIEKLKGFIENNNRKILKSINEHLNGSKINKDLKKELYDTFNDNENFKDIDIIIKTVIENIQNIPEKNKIWIEELNFFNKIYEKCIKVDRLPFKQHEDPSLYDILYNNTNIYFEDIYLYTENFLMSIALTLVSEFFNIDIAKGIEVVFGKNIVLKNPKTFDSKSNKYIKPVFNGKEVDKIKIPIDEKGYLDINFAGKGSSSIRTDPTTFDVYSYSDFIEGKGIYVRDKLVMVGAFSKGMVDDMYQTPFQTMYGLEIIANAVNTIITNNFIIKLSRIFYILILFFIAIAVSLISSYKSIIKAYIYVMVFIIAYVLLALVLFVYFNIVLEIPKVVLITVMTLLSIMVYRIFTEEKQKKQIKGIFSKYVNPSVVEKLLVHPPELGGVDANLTVFFSDIRGFTTLSETLTPQELIQHLNKYLTAMTDIIFQYEGTLDKYIGDAIMCFWGAPNVQVNHAELACITALKQMEKLKELNENWPEKLRLNIGIGINSGVMTVGNMGSEGRMNYTLAGDNVNLGSRLEGTNKIYETNIIVSENTYNLVKDKFIFRELDNIRVKGKLKPVSIFELVSEKE